jgi:hypothetical protein
MEDAEQLAPFPPTPGEEGEEVFAAHRQRWEAEMQHAERVIPTLHMSLSSYPQKDEPSGIWQIWRALSPQPEQTADTPPDTPPG